MAKNVRNTTSGNMLIYILGAIFLMGILIALLKGSFQEGTSIDGDKLVIQVGEVQRSASQMETAVNYIMRGNFSETDLRFARGSVDIGYGIITDVPARQVFSPQGGAAEYKDPASGINDGTAWQFYGDTHIPDIGTDGASNRSELIAVLPNVTEAFCNATNRALGQVINLSGTVASDCVHSGTEFEGTFTDPTTVTLDETKISKNPAKEACVRCSDGSYFYYRVLLSR